MTTAIPVDALLASVKPMTNADLTDMQIGGTGLFDQMMSTLGEHLAVQLEKGRINGNDYATVYLGGVQACMQNAIQYLTTRDQAYAQTLATAAQIQQSQAETAIAEQELKLKVTEQEIQLVQLDVAKADLELKKAQLPLITAQIEQAQSQVQLTTAQVADVKTKSPLEAQLLTSQNAQVVAATGKVSSEVRLTDAQTAQATAQTSVVTSQIELNNQQTALMREKVETERGQTLNTRTDGTPIGGIVATQKTLQTAQVGAFSRDAEQKAAKILMDTWVTRKTVDDGVEVPTNIDTSVINTVMQNLYSRAGLA